MDNIISKSNNKNNNKLTIEHKFLKKIEQSHSENNEKSNNKQNMDKETLNLFKGIVKLKKSNIKKTPETKYNTTDNIFNFTNYLYNNEEHLYKNQFIKLKHPENNPPDNNYIKFPNNSFPHRIDIKKDIKSINSGNGKNDNLIKNNFGNSSSLNPKRKIIHFMKKKVGDTTHKNNYSFFFKLKEKDKFPSKTPYLDKKGSNQIYDIKKYDFHNNTIGNKKINPNLNTPTAKQSLSSKSPKNFLNIIHSDKEKNISIINSDGKSSPSKGKENNNINNMEKIDEEKETKKFEDNSNKNIITTLKNENTKNKTNCIVFNILNAPFFCCLKS